MLIWFCKDVMWCICVMVCGMWYVCLIFDRGKTMLSDVKNILVQIYKCICPLGLEVWYCFRVAVVPSSNPGVDLFCSALLLCKILMLNLQPDLTRVHNLWYLVAVTQFAKQIIMIYCNLQYNTYILSYHSTHSTGIVYKYNTMIYQTTRLFS